MGEEIEVSIVKLTQLPQIHLETDADLGGVEWTETSKREKKRTNATEG